MDSILGMPLDQALGRLSDQDASMYRVIYTSARQEHAHDDLRTSRVVRVRGEIICAAYFRDGEPRTMDGEV